MDLARLKVGADTVEQWDLTALLGFTEERSTQLGESQAIAPFSSRIRRRQPDGMGYPDLRSRQALRSLYPGSHFLRGLHNQKL